MGKTKCHSKHQQHNFNGGSLAKLSCFRNWPRCISKRDLVPIRIYVGSATLEAVAPYSCTDRRAAMDCGLGSGLLDLHVLNTVLLCTCPQTRNVPRNVVSETDRRQSQRGSVRLVVNRPNLIVASISFGGYVSEDISCLRAYASRRTAFRTDLPRSTSKLGGGLIRKTRPSTVWFSWTRPKTSRRISCGRSGRTASST